jgi:hypothetical protein
MRPARSRLLAALPLSALALMVFLMMRPRTLEGDWA